MRKLVLPTPEAPMTTSLTVGTCIGVCGVEWHKELHGVYAHAVGTADDTTAGLPYIEVAQTQTKSLICLLLRDQDTLRTLRPSLSSRSSHQLDEDG